MWKQPGTEKLLGSFDLMNQICTVGCLVKDKFLTAVFACKAFGGLNVADNQKLIDIHFYFCKEEMMCLSAWKLLS
jgi:hypothetical protein